MRTKLSLIVVVFGLCPGTPAAAQIPPGYEVIQLTDTPVRDAWPRINNRRQIVYERRLDGTDESGEIFLYDDRTRETIRLTDDGVRDAYPHLNDDGMIVWSRFIGPNGLYGPTAEIMVRTPDGVVTRLTDNDTDDRAPKVNRRGHIVWTREMGRSRCTGGPIGDIFFYDGLEIRPITTDAVPDDVYNQVPQLNDRDQVVYVRFNFCAQPDWESEVLMYDDGVIIRLSEDQVQPNAPSINNETLVALAHRPPGSIVHSIDMWQDGRTTPLTDWGGGMHLNDGGLIALNRWHDDTQLWQQWLYRDGAFWQLSNDPFWNRDGHLNQIGDVVWRSGPTRTSSIRYMRRFSIGDVNCDRSIDAFDIEPFLLALFDLEEYRLAHPTCDALLADIDQSGSVDAFDIEPFINLLFP